MGMASSSDPPKMNGFSTGIVATAGSSSIPHYDPYAPPRKPATVSAPVASSSANGKALREFKRPYAFSYR